MEIVYPRGNGRYPAIVIHNEFECELCRCLGINIVPLSIAIPKRLRNMRRSIFDEFEYDSEMEYFCHWMLKKQLERPLNYLEVLI